MRIGHGISEKNQGNDTEESRYISDCRNFEKISANSLRQFHVKWEILDYDRAADRQEMRIENQEEILNDREPKQPDRKPLSVPILQNVDHSRRIRVRRDLRWSTEAKRRLIVKL
jgi:hypothetical protein